MEPYRPSKIFSARRTFHPSSSSAPPPAPHSISLSPRCKTTRRTPSLTIIKYKAMAKSKKQAASSDEEEEC